MTPPQASLTPHPRAGGSERPRAAATGEEFASGPVLYTMGAETANVHLGTPGAVAAIRHDLGRRPAGWLADAARSLSDRLEADWQAWRASR